MAKKLLILLDFRRFWLKSALEKSTISKVAKFFLFFRQGNSCKGIKKI